MRQILVALALFAAPAAAQVPQETLAATDTQTAQQQDVLSLNTLTVAPASASQGDFRAGNFIVNVTGSNAVRKVDALSGYAYNTGTANLTDSIYGGSLQFFNQGGATVTGWAYGGAANLWNENGRVVQGRALSAVAGTYSALSNGAGALSAVYGEASNRSTGGADDFRGGDFTVQNWTTGHVNSGSGARIFGYNGTGGDWDYFYGLRIDLSNYGTMDEAYLLYLNAPAGTAPASRWTIYSRSPWPSYFAADVRVAGRNDGVQAQLDALAARVAALEAAH